jgi:hypothetical protein
MGRLLGGQDRSNREMKRTRRFLYRVAWLCVTICSCSKGVPNLSNTPSDSGALPNTTGSAERQPATRVVRARRLSDIKLSTTLTREQVVDLWGPPDGEPATGADYKAYRLEDGRMLWLLFTPVSPEQLQKAIVWSRDGREREFLFGK